MIENFKPAEGVNNATFASWSPWTGRTNQHWFRKYASEQRRNPSVYSTRDRRQHSTVPNRCDLQLYSGFPAEGSGALARFPGLHVDDVFPITVDVRRYVHGDPKALMDIVLKEPPS